jgi:hypothetical protein
MNAPVILAAEDFTDGGCTSLKGGTLVLAHADPVRVAPDVWRKQTAPGMGGNARDYVGSNGRPGQLRLLKRNASCSSIATRRPAGVVL